MWTAEDFICKAVAMSETALPSWENSMIHRPSADSTSANMPNGEDENNTPVPALKGLFAYG